jgi:hypothetical protein
MNNDPGFCHNREEAKSASAAAASQNKFGATPVNI